MPNSTPRPYRIVYLPANAAWCLTAPDGQIVTLANGQAVVSGPRSTIVALLERQGLAVAKDGSVSTAATAN
jgi:hypothetical protein